jgi:hypothetical protein
LMKGMIVHQCSSVQLSCEVILEKW